MGSSQPSISVEDWRVLAENALPPGPYAYVAGGAGDEATMRENAAAFDRYRIVPCVLNEVADRDLTVSLLGSTFAAPIGLAPIGALGIVHEDGDVLAAQAASGGDIPFVLSTVSSSSIESVAGRGGPGERWFQLYPLNSRDVMASLIRRAESAGYTVLIVTVDTPLLGWRERDLRLGYLPFLQGQGMANLLTDPVFTEGRPQGDGISMETVMEFLGLLSNVRVDLELLRWICDQTSLPVLVKGILRAEDARRAIDTGAAGVVVSNHGGRQVDGAIAAIDAVAPVRDALGPDVPVLVDSGMRSGAHLLKALALGSNLALVGRPYVYALAAAGRDGVEDVIINLVASFDTELALSGIRSVREVDRSLLAL